jgi:peroxiredoxin
MKFYFCLLAVLQFAIAGAQKRAVVDGHIEGLPDGTKVWILSEDVYWKDSTVVRDNRFQFNLRSPLPGSYNIRLSRDFERGKWQGFYIDEGRLVIESKNASFFDLHVSGSPYAIELNRYFQALNADSMYSYLLKNIRSAEDIKKRNALKVILASQWIRENPASVINAYVLATDVKGNINSEQLRVLLEALPPKSKEDIFARDMLLELNAPQTTALGKIAPNFTQADTLGKPVSIMTFRGKYLLIDFWASWCEPCRAENPNLKNAFEKLKSRGLMVLGVSLDMDKKSWLQAIRQDKLNWAHVSDLNFWDNAAVKLYGIRSVPANVLIDPTGWIIAKDLRGPGLEAQLSALIK